MPEPTPQAPREQGENQQQAPTQTPEEARREEQRAKVRERYDDDYLERQEPFKLDDDILEEYQDVRAMNESLDKKTKLSISATFRNNRTVETYIEDVRENHSTGNIEYFLNFIQETLDKVKLSEFSSGLDEFIRGEEARLATNIEEAKRIIGNKERDSDGIYR